MRSALVSVVAVAALLAGACGGRSGTSARSLGPTCRVTLPPRATTLADADGGTGGSGSGGAPASPSPLHAASAAVSVLPIDVDVPLGTLGSALEAKVPRRVAEERDHDIGLAGRLEYVVDRGAFTVRGDGDALVVQTPLSIHARACAKGACYAGCDPEARATVRVPLRLGPDWELRRASAQFEITRGCELAVLGGVVRVDVTFVVAQSLKAERARLEDAINAQLPHLRPEVERAWGEAARTRALPLGACVSLSPIAVAQGAPSADADTAHLRFGVVARPELRLRCDEAPASSAPVAPAPSPLPPLRDDDALGKDGDTHLAVVLPKSAIAAAIEDAYHPPYAAPGDAGAAAASAPSPAIDLGSAGRTYVAAASGTASALVVRLAGDVCGDVTARATAVAWTPDGHGLALARVEIPDDDAARLASAGVDARALASALEKTTVPVPLATPDALRTALPFLARSAAAGEGVTVTARVTEAAPESARLDGDAPVGVVRLRGGLAVRLER